MKLTYLLIIALASFGISAYLGNRVILPTDEQGRIIWINLLIMTIFIDCAITALLSFIFLGASKLITGEYHVKKWGRRALITTATLTLLGYIRILGFWTPINILFSVGIGLSLEALLSLSLPQNPQNKSNLT